MSFDATRATWAARRSGALCGGTPLLVALAMADATFSDSGELVAGARGLAAVCGVSHRTVIDTQRELEAAGVVERVEIGRGSRPSRWRWMLAAPAPNTGTPRPVDNNGQRYSHAPPVNHESNAKADLRYSHTPPEVHMGNEYQDQVYPRVNSNFDEVVDRGAIPELVTGLRDALERGRRGPLSDGAAHAGIAPPAASNGAVGPHVDEPAGGHMAGYLDGDELCAPDADGWTP